MAKNLLKEVVYTKKYLSYLTFLLILVCIIYNNEFNLIITLLKDLDKFLYSLFPVTTSPQASYAFEYDLVTMLSFLFASIFQ